jgi:hypothetical protein
MVLRIDLLNGRLDDKSLSLPRSCRRNSRQLLSAPISLCFGTSAVLFWLNLSTEVEVLTQTIDPVLGHDSVIMSQFTFIDSTRSRYEHIIIVHNIYVTIFTQH